MVDDMSLDLLYYVEQRLISQIDQDQDSNYEGKEKPPKRIPIFAPIFSLTLNKDTFYNEN